VLEDGGDVEQTRHVIRVDHLQKYFPVHTGVVLRKTIGFVKAVDDVSFSIGEQETLALVGESGCGKTTTGKLILRLESPTGGQVVWNNSDVHSLRGKSLREYRLAVQCVFQDPWSSLNPRMRVRDIIAEALVINGHLPANELAERVSAVLAHVGLRPSQGALYPHEFSGGQRQRIALAAAIVANPRLIVLDEPVSGLDVSVQAQIMNLLKQLQTSDGISYLLVAHNLATVRYLAHQVAVMYLGNIVESASTDELFDHSLHPYTRALFSAALPAHPSLPREEIVLVGEVPSPINPPAGCRFHTRCPLAMKVCAEVIPAYKEAKPGHWVACHLY
jgi:oligopeptide/dipeptide ABC transporter ATP-binding protein